MADKKNNNFIVDVIVGIGFLIFCVYFYFKNSELSRDAALFPSIIIHNLLILNIALISKVVLKIYRKKEKF